MVPDKFDFSLALKLLKNGEKVKRAHWGGYWIYIENPVVIDDEDGDGFNLNPAIFAKLKDDAGYAPALAYQEDMLAEDWELV